MTKVTTTKYRDTTIHTYKQGGWWSYGEDDANEPAWGETKEESIDTKKREIDKGRA